MGFCYILIRNGVEWCGTVSAVPTLFLHRFCRLFYFFDFFAEPFRGTICVNAFGYIVYVVTNEMLDGIFIYLIFLAEGHKGFSRIVRTVIFVQTEGAHTLTKMFVIGCIRKDIARPFKVW